MFAYPLMFSSLSAAQSLLLPLVFLALFIDSVILVIWYFLGVLLNNSTVKASARNEFYQLAGTAVLIFVVLFLLLLAGNVLYSSLSATKLMNPTAIYDTLNSLSGTTQLSLLKPTNSLVSPVYSSTYPGLLNLVSQAETSPSNTIKLDYPLAATSVIVANLTNQTASNLNQMFYMDAFIGFLSKLTPESIFCVSAGSPCWLPLPTPDTTLFWLEVDYTPYAGYSLIYTSFKSLGVILTIALESFIAQLLAYTMLLYLWPYLIFIGLILRATFFTRKIGGLLIAAAIASVLILPSIFSLEYLSLGSGIPASIPPSYGFNSVTPLPASSGTGNYMLNFFVEPSIGAIATHNGCYPIIFGHTTLVGAELSDIVFTFVPFYALAPLLGGFLSHPISYYLPIGCPEQNALHTLFDSLNLYGIIGVIAYFLPIINLMIFLSAIQGLSGLMGGDTTLGGLSRLI